MKSKKKANLFEKAAGRILQVFSWMEIRINRRRYGCIDPAYDVRELHLFERLKPGDLVYCEMPGSDWHLASIPKGHRCRPYLVIEKGESGILGCPTSHQPYKKTSRWKQIEIGAGGHSRVYMHFGDTRMRRKTSFCDLSRPSGVAKEKILSYSMTIPEEEAARADRIFAAAAGAKGDLNPLHILPEGHRIRSGDLVRTGQGIVLVSGLSGGQVFGYPVSESRKKSVSPLPRIQAADQTYCQAESLSQISVPEEECVMTGFCTGEDPLAFEQEIRRQKSQKKKDAQPETARFTLNGVYFTHQPGEIFQNQYSGEEFIYFFSKTSADFYLSMEDYYDARFSVNCVKKQFLFSEQELVDEQTMQEILECRPKNQIGEDLAREIWQRYQSVCEEESSQE